MLCELADAARRARYDLVTVLPSPMPRTDLLSRSTTLVAAHLSRAHAAGHHRLFEPSASAQREYLGFQRAQPDAFCLFELLFLHRPVDSQAGLRVLGSALGTRLLHAGILKAANGHLTSTVRLVPYRDTLLMTDPPDRAIRDYAYLGRDSIGLAEFLENRLDTRRFEAGLDLCTGVGIHALRLAARSASVTGVDINPRALEYAEVNAAINGCANARFRRGNLAEGLEGRFDILVSNPPFRFLPDALKAVNRDGFGGAFGLEPTLAILDSLERLLTARGTAVILTVAPVVGHTNLLVQELTQRFAGKPFQVELLWTDLSYSGEHHALYRRHRISHFLSCYLTVKRAGAFRLSEHTRIARPRLKRAVIQLKKLAVRA